MIILKKILELPGKLVLVDLFININFFINLVQLKTNAFQCWTRSPCFMYDFSSDIFCKEIYERKHGSLILEILFLHSDEQSGGFWIENWAIMAFHPCTKINLSPIFLFMSHSDDDIATRWKRCSIIYSQICSHDVGEVSIFRILVVESLI